MFREEQAQQSVEVLIGAALPGSVGMREIVARFQFFDDPFMLCKLLAVPPANPAPFAPLLVGVQRQMKRTASAHVLIHALINGVAHSHAASGTRRVLAALCWRRAVSNNPTTCG